MLDKIVAYGGDGRLINSYVYMLLCRDDGPVYVKVGMSDDPIKRFRTLRNGCPVEPRRLLFCGVRSRKVATRVEAKLICAFGKWAAHGEWFRVPMDDKPEFNKQWQQVFEAEGKKTLGEGWTQIPVAEIVRQAQARKKYWQKRYATGGAAWQDYCKHGA